MPEKTFELAYFPYLSLSGIQTLRYGRVRVWNASSGADHVPDQRLRERVTALLESHRAPSGRPDRSQPLAGIGVVSFGHDDFAPLTPSQLGDLQEFRYGMFLACLANNVRLRGANAGHSLFTSENFSFIRQRFSLERPYIAEVTGVIVRMTLMGYKIGEVQFRTPAYVPRPSPFRYDDALLQSLWRLRRVDRRTYRRVLSAAAVFLESYYNDEAVDIRARVLLQAAAFEILLDLPQKEQRKGFKDQIERLCAARSERRYRYKYEVHGTARPESRTQKGIWADRFYTLRNHIIHGEAVPRREYLYRGVQHHLSISPMFFVMAVKAILADAVAHEFFERLEWVVPASRVDPNGEDEASEGYQVNTDWRAFFEAQHGKM